MITPIIVIFTTTSSASAATVWSVDLLVCNSVFSVNEEAPYFMAGPFRTSHFVMPGPHHQSSPIVESRLYYIESSLPTLQGLVIAYATSFVLMMGTSSTGKTKEPGSFVVIEQRGLNICLYLILTSSGIVCLLLFSYPPLGSSRYSTTK